MLFFGWFFKVRTRSDAELTGTRREVGAGISSADLPGAAPFRARSDSYNSAFSQDCGTRKNMKRRNA